MGAEPRRDLTLILGRARAGDERARSDLIAMVYDELRQVAARLMRRERQDHTLPPTAVVHEAVIRLLGDAVFDKSPDRAFLFAAAARARTGGRGVQVVYDSVGKTTFDGSLASLAARGMLVLFGQSSGPVPPFDPQRLAMKGSLYLTRPALADYIADPAEKNDLAGELFAHVAAGRIRIEINQRYALQDAAQAHRDLESRKTTGSSVFIV